MNNLSIGKRLTLAFALLGILLVGMAALGFYQMSVINGHLTEILEVNDVEKDYAANMRFILDGRAIAARDVALAGNSTVDRDKAIDRLKKLRQEFSDQHDKLLALLKSANGQPQEFDALAKIMDENVKATKHIDELVQLAQSGKGYPDFPVDGRY